MTKTKEPIWARIISNVLHPLFMASYGLMLLFIFTDFGFYFPGQFYRFLIPVILMSCAIPICIIFSLKQLGYISDYDITIKEERFLPFSIILLSYIFLLYYFYSAEIYIFWFLAMLAAPILIMMLGAAINVFWKISAHMAGIGCLIGTVFSICYYIKAINPYPLFIILIILAGALGTSRLVLKRHTPAQVYGGFALGLIVSYAVIWMAANYTYIYILKYFNP